MRIQIKIFNRIWIENTIHKNRIGQKPAVHQTFIYIDVIFMSTNPPERHCSPVSLVSQTNRIRFGEDGHLHILVLEERKRQ
jgi:hypothetical protein